MTARHSHLVAVLAGLVLAGAHAVLFPGLMDMSRREPFRVHVTAPPAAPALDVRAELPEHLRARARLRMDGRDIPAGATPAVAPGMHRLEWRVAYRGGFVEAAGMTQLVGPFQDPAAPPCSVRVIIGQPFLDSDPAHVPDPGTLAGWLRATLERRLAGVQATLLGRFVDVSDLRLRWVRFADLDPGVLRELRGEPDLLASVAAGSGGLRATMALRFRDGLVRLWVLAWPRVEAGTVQLATHVRAALHMDSFFDQLLVDLFDGDGMAQEAAGHELGDALRDGFALPPLELPGGHRLELEPCPGSMPQVVTGQYAALALRLLPPAGSAIAPVFLGRPDRPETTQFAGVPGHDPPPLAVELDLDAVNGILHRLWESGVLTDALRAEGLDQKFNADPRVQELLSVRIGDLTLPLPPTVWPERDGRLRLGVEAGLGIRDRGLHTVARVFGVVGIEFQDAVDPRLVARLGLDELSLTCIEETGNPATPGVLMPCYSDLVAGMRERAGDLHGALSQRFTRLFTDLVLGRHIALQGAHFQVDQARVNTRSAGSTALIRVDLHGRLHPVPE